MINTKELRRLAQAATPGPWYVTGKLTRYVEARIDGGLIQEVAACGPTKADGGYGPQQEANARLIAAANPATISELLDRLEAAEKAVTEAYQRGYETGQEEIEKELAELRSSMKFRTSLIGRTEAERDALRAKLEAMEQQEPVGKFIQHPSNGIWEQDGYGDNPDARPLYALPGAQPAPSVPTPGMIDAAEYVDWGDADVRGSCINAWNRLLFVAPEAKP